jgi:peptide/nickel transport system permease protein
MRIHRHIRHPSLVIGAVVVGVIVLVATFAPWVTSYDPEQMDMANRLAGPSRLHILGTDNFGRDLWTRVAFGARISLVIGLISVSVAAVAGTLVGLVAGYYRGWVDLLLMRVVDLFLGFPPIILALALVAALGPGVVNVTIALVAVFWTQYARVVRAITVVESEREYVAAARAIGMPGARILLRQILPGTIGPVVVLATLRRVGSEFLGLRRSAPDTDVGVDVSLWDAFSAHGCLVVHGSGPVHHDHGAGVQSIRGWVEGCVGSEGKGRAVGW